MWPSFDSRYEGIGEFAKDLEENFFSSVPVDYN